MTEAPADRLIIQFHANDVSVTHIKLLLDFFWGG